MLKYYAMYLIERFGRKNIKLTVCVSICSFAFLSVFLLMLPLYADLLLLSCACLLMRRGRAKTVLTSSVLLLAALLAAATVYESRTPYANYRTSPDPEARYRAESPFHGFEPLVDVLYPIPYGDLAEKPGFPASLRRARTIRFKTDPHGFRNDKAPAGEQLLLVGDGFVSGSGIDHTDTLARTLRRLHGIDAYSLAAPGTLQQRFDGCLAFQKQIRRGADIALFFSEGGDFSGTGLVVSVLPRLPKLAAYKYWRIKQAFAGWLETHAGTRMFAFLQALFSGYDAELFRADNPHIVIERVGNQPIAFLAAHVDVANCETLAFHLPEPHLQVLRHVQAVYFIPTKYRVYHHLLAVAPGMTPRQPPPGVRALEQFFLPKGIPVYDLTPTLQEAAASALRNGELVHWADDTHWNAAGVRCAASFVAATIHGQSADD